MQEGRQRAIHEVRTCSIQRIYRGWRGRKAAKLAATRKSERLARQRLEERSMRLIIRIGHGKIGRIRAQQRRTEIALAYNRWISALLIERVFRGHQGRLRWRFFYELKMETKRNAAATFIQRVYRGYRGALLASVARALRALRQKQHFFAVEVQRFIRGCMGRIYFARHKERVTLRRRLIAAAIVGQRVFRGYKGREAAEIEKELQVLDSKAKPLMQHLRSLEEVAVKLRKTISRMEEMDDMMKANLFELERELEHCKKTTNQYTDSMRVNNTPQRFLTKFLIVRLQDLLEHETVKS